MKKKYSTNRFMKCITFIASSMLVFVLTTSAYAEWRGGIGLGMGNNYRDGDIGYRTVLFGDVEFEYDLDPDDFDDLVESAFGFAGYLSDGRWMIEYTVGHLELEDDSSYVLPSAQRLEAEMTFKTTMAEVTVGHPVLRYEKIILGVHTGLRYMKHDYESEIENTTTSAFIKREFDHDWTDLILGVTLMIPVTKTVRWNNKLNAGFGGSEGTYLGSTGVAWQFHKNFSTGITAKVMAVEYENDSKGDSDWYLYDVDESSLTVNLVFHW